MTVQESEIALLCDELEESLCYRGRSVNEIIVSMRQLLSAPDTKESHKNPQFICPYSTDRRPCAVVNIANEN